MLEEAGCRCNPHTDSKIARAFIHDTKKPHWKGQSVRPTLAACTTGSCERHMLVSPTERFHNQYLGTCFLKHIWSIQEYLLYILLHQRQRYPSTHILLYMYFNVLSVFLTSRVILMFAGHDTSHISPPSLTFLATFYWRKKHGGGGDANKATAQPSLTCM